MADKPYRDPKTTKIEDWKWRPLEAIKAELAMRDIPDYIQKGFGGFMNEQAGRAQRGEMTPRDLIKAYTIAQSSIGRGGLSHGTASKMGMRLPNTGGEVRPEGAFAEWLGSTEGQHYLDAAERGVADPSAIADLQYKFAPFGKQNDQASKMAEAARIMPGMSGQLNAALTGSADDYRDFAEKLKGIAGAKSGFIGSLLGRGDLPTLDARQINLHTLPAPVGVGSIMSRGKGKGAREAVDRLSARQRAMGLSIDPSLLPHYQHLAHHAVWDKTSGTETTHDDLMRAMRGYAEGGNVNPTVEQMRRAIAGAAQSAGMKAPVVNKNDMTTVHDTHASLGDEVRRRAADMQNMIESTPFKYEAGQHVFTEHGAKNNRPPMKIIRRVMVGNDPMREEQHNITSKVIKDPATGKTKRTPYEPGYHVRQENGEQWHEYRIPEKAIIGHLAKGGEAKKEYEPTFPLDLPKAPVPSSQEMQAIVDRVARQQAGEHVRGDTANNLAGRSMRESARVQQVPYGLKPTKKLRPTPVYNAREGDINVVLPGDQTVSDMMLEHVAGVPINSQQEGGSRYGEGKMHIPKAKRPFWASGPGPAQAFQNKVTKLAQLTGEDPRIIAHHLAMGNDANNFAMHLADANLKAIHGKSVTPENMDTFNRIMQAGDKSTGPFPHFPGVHKPDETYEALLQDPEMRKYFNNRMKTPNITQALGMPNGLDIDWAISHPELRNMEINMTGHSVGRMKPGAELIPGSEHNTYSHDITGEALGRAPELAPLELAFLDATHYIKPRLSAPRHYTKTMQGSAPHQVVDERYLNMMNDYYHRLRKTRGFAEGGNVEPSQDEMLAHIMLHKADGGAVNIKDIGIDEAPDMPIKEFVPPSGGGGIPPGGVDFEPLTPGNQMMPAQPGQPPQGQAPGQPPAMGQPPQGQAPQGPLGQPRPGGPLGQPQSNILSMTPQGQALQAMRPSRMATGGAVKRNIVKIDWPT